MTATYYLTGSTSHVLLQKRLVTNLTLDLRHGAQSAHIDHRRREIPRAETADPKPFNYFFLAACAPESHPWSTNPRTSPACPRSSQLAPGPCQPSDHCVSVWTLTAKVLRFPRSSAPPKPGRPTAATAEAAAQYELSSRSRAATPTERAETPLSWPSCCSSCCTADSGKF